MAHYVECGCGHDCDDAETVCAKCQVEDIRAAEIRGATWALEAVSAYFANGMKLQPEWPLNATRIVDERRKGEKP